MIIKIYANMPLKYDLTKRILPGSKKNFVNSAKKLLRQRTLAEMQLHVELVFVCCCVL